MDLRRRLVASLGLMLAALLLATAALQLISLRSDIAAEAAATTRLVNLLAAISAAPPDHSPTLRQQLAQAPLRHISLRTPESAPAPLPESSLLSWLGLRPPLAEQRVRIGSQTLLIAPNPSAEFDEHLAGSVKLWSTLLLFSGTCLLIAWYSADRALAPVRALEASLFRLAQGQDDPALPTFALREFRRVAQAIDHLAAALADARAKQQALARQLITVQEEERRKLARELHDDMGQTLAALNVTATYIDRNAARLPPDALAECANELRRDLQTCGLQLRAMLKSLRPHGLHACGLASTLRELVQGWRSRRNDLAFTLELPRALPEIDDNLAVTIYRVVQEGLTNALRHSGARHCSVRLLAGTHLVLEVSDDGCGLAPEQRWNGGLLGMQERVAMAGGRFELRSAPGIGLSLRAAFPAGAQP